MAGPFIAMAWLPLRWIDGGAVAAYLAAVLVTSIAIAARREPRLLGRLPLVFPTVHAGARRSVLAELHAGRLPAR